MPTYGKGDSCNLQERTNAKRKKKYREKHTRYENLLRTILYYVQEKINKTLKPNRFETFKTEQILAETIN